MCRADPQSIPWNSQDELTTAEAILCRVLNCTCQSSHLATSDNSCESDTNELLATRRQDAEKTEALFFASDSLTNTTACGQVGKIGVAFLRSHCYTRSFGPRVTCKLGHPAHHIDSSCRQPRAAVGLTWGAGRLGKPLELCVCACPCEVHNRPSIIMSYHKHCESHLGNCQTHDRHDSF